MVFQIGGMYVLDRILTDVQPCCHLLQCRSAQQVGHKFRKPMRVSAIACGETYLLLLVIVAFLAFVASHFHVENGAFHANREDYNAAHAIAVLDQNGFAAVRTMRFSLGIFHIKN